MRRGFKLIIAALVVLVLALMVVPAFFDLKPKIEADAYVCGEEPTTTYYCKVGTGPPRSDCVGPSNGEFDIEGTTIC
jgi:hypothetical protein